MIMSTMVCVLQKERFIQISKVDDEERKRIEQQKHEREQVTSDLLAMIFLWLS